MPDREKVISKLQILRTWCAVNPDYDTGLSAEDCVKAVGWLDNAIALLKAQEPKVLQLNEIHRGMTVWIEDVDKSELLLSIGGASCHYAKTFITENDRSIAAEDSEYNIRWRAWTSRPTDEQREAVKW